MARCICLGEWGACSKSRHGYFTIDRQSSKFPSIKEEQLAARLSNQFTHLWDIVYFSKITIKHSEVEWWGFFCLEFFLVCISLEIALSYIFNFILLCCPPARVQALMQVLIYYVDLYPHRGGTYAVYQGYPPQMDKKKKKPPLTPKTEIQMEWNLK